MVAHIGEAAMSFNTKSVWPARSRSRKFSRLFDCRVPNQVNRSLPICVQGSRCPSYAGAPVSSTDTQGDVS